MLALSYAVPSILIFITAALLTLVGAFGVLVMKNPVHSALSLIMTLFGVAVAFIAHSAEMLMFLTIYRKIE